MMGDARNIQCPRCSAALEAYGRTSDQAEYVVADMCLQCGGVWLDGAEVGKVYPALARLELMQPEPDPQAGLVTCPRCDDPTTGFRFFDVIIDHCATCRGLWVDGPELVNLARHRDREDGLAAAQPVESYRDNASRALRQAMIVCTRCKVEVPLHAVVSTHEGPLCAACAKALELETIDADLADYKIPKRWF